MAAVDLGAAVGDAQQLADLVVEESVNAVKGGVVDELRLGDAERVGAVGSVTGLDGVAAVADAELAIDRALMGLDRVERQMQRGCDLGGRHRRAQ